MTQSTTADNGATVAFSDLGLSEAVLNAVDELGYEVPSPVQAQAIPYVLQGRDLLAAAQTGTGKTAAFLLPTMSRLGHAERHRGPLMLIVTPTRELAQQIADVCKTIENSTHHHSVTVVGGVGYEPQKAALRRGTDILVATPGRLVDLIEQGEAHLGDVEVLVLDEADRMLDMGFFDDVTKILNRIKNRVNLGLFSATISQEVMTVSWMYQRDEVEITVAPTAESKPDIDQYSITVPRLEKEEATLRILRSGVFERVIVFCNTKVMCQNLSDGLRRSGIQADCLHGDIKQATREKTMAAFRNGKLPVLIATDVASRGIDVDDVDAVINYDVPDENEYYIHRIGRTGRARKKGISFTLVGSLPERVKLDEIAKFADFHITPMIFDEYGCLVPAPAEEKHPPRKRF